MDLQNFNWRRLHPVQRIHRFLYAIGLGPVVGRFILLLTTTGRKSGQQRVTPLQYEEIEGAYYLGSARGLRADWVRNIQASARVFVQVKNRSFHGTAQVLNDATQIANFLETRLQHHPRMVGAILKMHDLPPKPSRAQLEELAKTLAVVVIHPLPDESGDTRASPSNEH